MEQERDPEIVETTEAADGMTGPMPVVVALFLLFVVVAGIVDLALDRPDSWRSAHVAVEVALVVVSFSFAVVLFRSWRRSQSALAESRASLAATTASGR